MGANQINHRTWVLTQRRKGAETQRSIFISHGLNTKPMISTRTWQSAIDLKIEDGEWLYNSYLFADALGSFAASSRDGLFTILMDDELAKVLSSENIASQS